MQITEVNIVLIKPRDGLIGFASIVINDAVYLGSIGIHKKLDGSGFRLTYPTKKSGLHNTDIFRPINRAAGLAIENAVMTKLKNVMKRLTLDAGYRRPDIA